MRSFDEVWLFLTRFAQDHSQIATLARGVVNTIEAADNTKIRVRSQSEKSTKARLLLKDDFRYAWSILARKGSLTFDDVDPKLRGRKSIVFAFLSKVKGVSYHTDPVVLRLSLD